MVPRRAHFIWLGPEFPWLFAAAVGTAAARGGFEEVVLHHDTDLSGQPGYDWAIERPGVRTRRIDPEALVAASSVLGNALVDLYRAQTLASARANILRAVILAEEGGVYLDTDTVTLRDFGSICDGAGVFCGNERIVLPREIARSRRPDRWAVAAVRLAARDLCRRLPQGPELFARLESLYPAAVNNAVFGAGAGHPFVLELLDRMVAMPADLAGRRYALGTHLLQTMVAQYGGQDLVVHPPETFYPVPPEISEHWFRIGSHPGRRVVPQTVLVHWYASVRTRAHVARIGSECVGEAPSDVPICGLIRESLGTDENSGNARTRP